MAEVQHRMEEMECRAADARHQTNNGGAMPQWAQQQESTIA